MIKRRNKISEADLAEDPLLAEVRALNALHILRKQNGWGRMIFYQVIRGMAFGFGSLMGATVIVSIVIAFLGKVVSEVDFIPVLNVWISNILEIIEANQPQP